MDIAVADQRILILQEELGQKEAERKAWEKKTLSFDAIAQFGGFLSRPKDSDFELIYQEHRFQPFWHVAASAHYVYDRSATYEVSTSGPEVKSITEQKTDFKVINGRFQVPVMEHCVTDENDEVFIDGVTGKNMSDLKRYITCPVKVVKGKMETMIAKNSIVVPPQARVSATMREALAKMIKGIQADKILEETVKVGCVDLYYRPIYAFKYRWISKQKEAIVEVDAMTSETRTGNRTFSEYLGQMIDQEFLFDIGRDAASMLVPGGGIAVKIVKRYVDTRKAAKK